jgi:hypothetical protein
VDLAFATSQLDPGDRLEAWRELVSRVFLPLAIAPIGVQGLQGGFTGTVTGRDVAGVQVWHVSASPMSAVRAPRHSCTGSSHATVRHLPLGSASNGCASAEMISPIPGLATSASPRSPPAGDSAALLTSPAPSGPGTGLHPPGAAVLALTCGEPAGQGLR